MAELYLTFGVKYGTEEEQDAWGKDPHPTSEWATGKGYLTVEYNDADVALFEKDANGRPLPGARERARLAAWAWLGGFYAFEYDTPPEPEHAPLGEIARLVLP